MTVQNKEPGSAEDKVPSLIVDLLAALHNALDDSEDTGDGNLLAPEDVQALDHLLGELLTHAPKPDGYVATPAANVRQYFALRAANQAPQAECAHEWGDFRCDHCGKPRDYDAEMEGERKRQACAAVGAQAAEQGEPVLEGYKLVPDKFVDAVKVMLDHLKRAGTCPDPVYWAVADNLLPMTVKRHQPSPPQTEKE